LRAPRREAIDSLDPSVPRTRFSQFLPHLGLGAGVVDRYGPAVVWRYGCKNRPAAQDGWRSESKAPSLSHSPLASCMRPSRLQARF